MPTTSGLGAKRGADHRELHPAGLRGFHGHGHGQRHDARSESGQQHRHATITGVAVADLASAVAFPASVNAGQPVSGTVTYTNNGPSTASTVSFGLTLSANLPAAPTLSGLPAGATYSYNASSGVVTFTGMPATLASGATVGPITVSYTQPPAGTSTVTATVHSSTLDPNPANNTATASITGVPVADLASRVTFPASEMPARRCRARCCTPMTDRAARLA
jgi:uncharacterized repeat protein (TIGR01451 family)